MKSEDRFTKRLKVVGAANGVAGFTNDPQKALDFVECIGSKAEIHHFTGFYLLGYIELKKTVWFYPEQGVEELPDGYFFKSTRTPVEEILYRINDHYSVRRFGKLIKNEPPYLKD